MRGQTQRTPGAGRGFESASACSGHNHHNPVELLLARLEGVRKAGKGWRSQCPSCGGRSTKVSISEADTGAVLLHAFCGCVPAEVLGAVGLTLADLFPYRLGQMSEADKREAKRHTKEARWGAALDVLAFEATVVEIAAAQLLEDQALDWEDFSRLVAACARISDARAVLK